jgi:hypothetical protein
MEPTTIIVATYVSQKFIDQFIKDEGYGKLKKLLFPEKKYKTQLISIIGETIEEHKRLYPIISDGAKFHFYQSQIMFEELNKFILFKTQTPQNEYLVEKFRLNPNIIIPSDKELTDFYTLFVSKINEDKKLRSLHFDENYKSKIFELSEDLKRIESKIDGIHSKVTALEATLLFNPDSEWFKNQSESSIIDLGKRYTPELNFELEVSKIFDGLGRTHEFKKLITNKFDNLLIKGKKILKDKEEIKVQIQKLEDYFEKLLEAFSKINFENHERIPFDILDKHLCLISDLSEKIYEYYISEEVKLQKEKNDYKYYHKYGHELSNIREFRNALYDFNDLLSSDICQLANNPFLVFDGDAGIGKSHMLGDIISKRIQNDYESVFLLGQHFTTNENPWSQIQKKLQLTITSETFLKTINERAEKTGKRIIIFIDAINEGQGKYFWHDNIKSFINEIKGYEYIGLVLSIRSSYKNLILPKEEVKYLNIIEHTIYGFRNNEYEASKLFFSNYNIQLPNVPLLHPEFQNPLFLKLFCEGIYKSGQTKIPDGIQGISSIINFFIKNVNEILSRPNKFDYSNGVNLVDKSISSIIQFKIENNLRYVSYEKAIELIEDTISKFVTKKGTFLDELISEGIFSKNLFWKASNEYEEGIYLAYERFEDHLLCKYLLEKHEDCEVEFKETGNLYKYVSDENSLYHNKGLIDAFSIQIPEKTGKELYEFTPLFKEHYIIIESFIESLLWRKVETINENSEDYINNCVSIYDETCDFFWETLLSVASIPEHYYNAYSLHNHLMKFSMADRDSEWTQLLKDKYEDNSSVKRLIDWAWAEEDKSHISDESIKLTCITLAWFHTSTNRELRDSATKALVNLLQNRIHILLDILKIFENTNDPYVYERLFAVAYGCTLRTTQKTALEELSEYIFAIIFNNKEEVYPHVLLRDYARGVIEYTHHLGLSIPFKMEIIRPPYTSNFPTAFLSNDEIDKRYKFKHGSEGFKKHYWSQNEILSSMTTEYGRGTGGYGDFGRYIFQCGLSSWDVNPDNLSNYAIELIFEKYGYDVEKHGLYDNNLDYYGRKASTIERIGKKYQWLAFYEIIARVSDNFRKFEEYDYKKEVEEPYQGPWEPYIRDIDPTILIKTTGSYNEEDKVNLWWLDKNIFNYNCSNLDWVKKTDNLPNMEELIEVTDFVGEEWLILQSFPEWAEAKKIGEEKWDYAHKRQWCQVRSYMVKEDEFEKFQNWAIKQDFMGRWMPEARSRFEVFDREYYWSPAYKYFLNDYYGGETEREVYDKKTNELITSVNITVENYSWEEEFDKSKEETIDFLKPSLKIFEGMQLEYSKKEGEFNNLKGELICFSTNVNNNSKQYFLIKKKPFLDYLQENKLRILWTILGEKQIIGGRTFREDYIGMLEYSGAYFYSEGKLNGKITTKER